MLRRNSSGSKSLPRPSMYARCSLQRGDPGVDGAGHVHEVIRRSGGRHVGIANGVAARPCLGEHPLIGRVPAGIQHGQADGAVVGVVDRPLLAPGQVEAHRDDDLGAQPPEGRGQVAAQRDAVLHQPVLVIQELHVGDADKGGPAHFLIHPQRPDGRRVHARDAGLAAGGQHIGHLLALPGPPGHGRGGAVLQVIRVRNDGDGSLPVLGHCPQRRYRLRHLCLPALAGS